MGKSYIDYRILVATYGKRCPLCKKKKAPNEFGNASSRHDGKQVYCKECFGKKYGATKREYCRGSKQRKKAKRYYGMYILRKREKERLRAAGITDEELIKLAAQEWAEEEYPRWRARLKAAREAGPQPRNNWTPYKKEYARKYREKNREKIREYNRAYKERRKEARLNGDS